MLFQSEETKTLEEMRNIHTQIRTDS